MRVKFLFTSIIAVGLVGAITNEHAHGTVTVDNETDKSTRAFLI